MAPQVNLIPVPYILIKERETSSRATHSFEKQFALLDPKLEFRFYVLAAKRW